MPPEPRTLQERIDVLQREILSLPAIAGLVEDMKVHPGAVELPVVHRFTPGIYIRELFVPKGTAVVTMMHRVEHPFVISQGAIKVWTKENGVVTLTAPHCGITKPGTIRLAVAVEDTIWTTFHPTTKTNVEEIEKEVVYSPAEAAELLENGKGESWLLSQ